MASVTTHQHHHPHATTVYEDFADLRIQRLAIFLESHFGDIELHSTVDETPVKQEETGHRLDPHILIRVDGYEASIDLATLVCSSILKAYFY